MENDLEIIRKIREKEDQEDSVTKELREKLARELDEIQAESTAKVANTRKSLSSDYEKKIKSLAKKMDELREGAIADARTKAASMKIEMPEKDLRELVARILKEYLEA